MVDDTRQGSPEARPARSPIGRVGHPRRGNRSGGGRHVLALGGRVLGIAGIMSSLMRAGAAARVRERHPCAFVRRWPRWSDLALVLVVTVTTLGLGFLPALVSIWCVRADRPPEASAARIYRADRLTTVVYGLAFTPFGALMAILVLSPVYGSVRWLAGTLLIALIVGVWARSSKGAVIPG